MKDNHEPDRSKNGDTDKKAINPTAAPK